MKPLNPREFKVMALRECPVPEEMLLCDTPEKAADYWRLSIATDPRFNPDCECLAVLLLNTRRRLKGHAEIALGKFGRVQVVAVNSCWAKGSESFGGSRSAMEFRTRVG